MRRRRTESFSVHTARGRGSYRSSSKAHAAALWVAAETGEAVTVVNERTGQSWEVLVGQGSDQS